MNLSSVPNISKTPHHPFKSPKNVGWLFSLQILPTPKIHIDESTKAREEWHLSTTSHASRQLADLDRIFLDSLDSWIYPTPLDRVGLDCPPGWRWCVCVCVLSEVLWIFWMGLAWINFGHVVWGSHKPENHRFSTLESVDFFIGWETSSTFEESSWWYWCPLRTQCFLGESHGNPLSRIGVLLWPCDLSGDFWHIISCVWFFDTTSYQNWWSF